MATHVRGAASVCSGGFVGFFCLGLPSLCMATHVHGAASVCSGGFVGFLCLGLPSGHALRGAAVRAPALIGQTLGSRLAPQAEVLATAELAAPAEGDGAGGAERGQQEAVGGRGQRRARLG